MFSAQGVCSQIHQCKLIHPARKVGNHDSIHGIERGVWRARERLAVPKKNRATLEAVFTMPAALQPHIKMLSRVPASTWHQKNFGTKRKVPGTSFKLIRTYLVISV